MKITVLVDNNTYIDQYYLGEPAASYLIEDNGIKILFDTGYSDVYVKNSIKMGIKLEDVDIVAISHGHNDHTGGLRYFPELDRKIKLVAHPNVFERKRINGCSIGSPIELDEAKERFDLQLSAKPVQLSQHITFLGEIKRTSSFENKKPIGERMCENGWSDDYVMDDTALIYNTDEGIYIITGCSHSGICNIAEYAKIITGNNHILGIIGGLHLLNKSEQLDKTIEYMKKEKIKGLYPCHCTSFEARSEIDKTIPVKEVGVGLTLLW